MSEVQRDSDFCLRIGSEESFHLVHRFLKQSGYTEAWLLHRFELPTLHDLLYPRGQRGEEFRRRYQGPGLTALMARLLMGGLAATTEELDAYVPVRVQDALHDLGLLTPKPDDPSRFFCPALVYPA